MPELRYPDDVAEETPFSHLEALMVGIIKWEGRDDTRFSPLPLQIPVLSGNLLS